MRHRGNRTKPKGEFGREVTKCLIALEADNNRLWKALRDGGESLSYQYLNMLVNGTRHPTIRMIDNICQCLGADGDRRIRLHKAAAIDAGYNLGPL